MREERSIPRAVAIVLAAIALFTVGVGVAITQTDDEPTVVTTSRTFTNVNTAEWSFTIPTETVISTVTVTEPGTTTEPPTTTTEPEPPTGEVIDVVVTNQLGWVCNRQVEIALLRVFAPLSGNSDNAVTFDPGCSGVIHRIEITTERVDGIKIRNNSVTPSHDLVINGGFIRSANCVPGGHCDGVQGMGGDRITFNDILIDFRDATGGGGFYPSLGGAGTGGNPTDIVCDGCHIIHGATSVRVDASDRSGVRNSVICDPIGAAEHANLDYNHGDTQLVAPVGVNRFPVVIRPGFNEDALSDGNVLARSNDLRCVTEP